MTATIVLVSVDSLRADHCSSLGYDRETTPGLTAAASRGTLYERCYAQSSHTRESMPSLLYGTYPPRLPAVGRTPEDRPSVATIFRDDGWETAAFHSNPYLSRAYGFDEGFETFEDGLPLATNRIGTFLHRVRNHFSTEPYTRAERLNERALDWLSTRSDRPAFVWVHYMDPHGPYQPPPDFQRQFRDDVVDADRAKRLWRRSVDDPDSLSDGDVETLVDLYDAEVRYTDDQVCALIDELDDRDDAGETVVAVASDHGDLFGEHGRYGHPRRVDEELVHVPLLVLGDGVDDATVAQPVENVDVVPTLLDAADIDPRAAVPEASEIGDSSDAGSRPADRSVPDAETRPDEGSWPEDRSPNRDPWPFDGTSLFGSSGEPTGFSFASGEDEEADRFWAALRGVDRVATGVWTTDGACVDLTVEEIRPGGEAVDGSEAAESDGAGTDVAGTIDLRARLHAVLEATGATAGSVEEPHEPDDVDGLVADRLERLGYR